MTSARTDCLSRLALLHIRASLVPHALSLEKKPLEISGTNFENTTNDHTQLAVPESQQEQNQAQPGHAGIGSIAMPLF